MVVLLLLVLIEAPAVAAGPRLLVLGPDAVAAAVAAPTGPWLRPASNEVVDVVVVVDDEAPAMVSVFAAWLGLA